MGGLGKKIAITHTRRTQAPWRQPSRPCCGRTTWGRRWFSPSCPPARWTQSASSDILMTGTIADLPRPLPAEAHPSYPLSLLVRYFLHLLLFLRPTISPNLQPSHPLQPLHHSSCRAPPLPSLLLPFLPHEPCYGVHAGRFLSPRPAPRHSRCSMNGMAR